MVIWAPSPSERFGHRKATVPPRNSSDRRPTPTPSMRRMKVRREISPVGGPCTGPYEACCVIG